MKNLTRQNPGQLFVAQELINKVKSKCCGIKVNLIKADPDDNKFVDCAIVSGAKCIVTEDKHFRVLDSISFPHVDIVGIDAFISTLK